MKDNNIAMHKCEICDEEFEKVSSLTHHTKTTHYSEDYECFICNRKFASSSQLRCHQKSHKTKTYHCDLCEYYAASLKTIRLHKNKKHKESHVPDESGKCSFCDKFYLNVLQHVNDVHTEKLKASNVTYVTNHLQEKLNLSGI